MVKQRVKIILIDQLSKIRGGKGKDIFAQNTNIVNELAEFKKELRIPICLLVQINRKAEESKRPYLNHLKNTGCIHPDSIVMGQPIQEIVNNQLSIKIKSCDVDTNKIKEILPSRYIHSGKKQGLRIRTKSGKEIILSRGTKLFDGKVWRQSRTFIVGEKILVDFSRRS